MVAACCLRQGRRDAFPPRLRTHLERLEHLPPVLLGLLGILLQASHQHLAACGPVRHHVCDKFVAWAHLQYARQLLLLVRHAGQLGALGGAGEARLVGSDLLDKHRRAGVLVPHYSRLLVRLNAAPLRATGHMLQLRRQGVHDADGVLAEGTQRGIPCQGIGRADTMIAARHLPCTYTSSIAPCDLHPVRIHVT